MEQQRIGSITPSVPAAGLDPAFVPGLTPPRSDADGPAEASQEPQAAPEAESAPEAEEAAAPEEAAAETDPAEAPETETAAADAEADAEDTEAADTEDAEDADAVSGPELEATDRRGGVVANRLGVRFRLDEEEAEFTWDEIAAVEMDTPRFGKRFTVTVYTPERRWYEAQVEATSRARLKEWAAKLDEVLDAYFEADEPEPEEPEEADEAAAPEEAEETAAEETASEEPEGAKKADDKAEATADTDAEDKAEVKAEVKAEDKADAEEAEPAEKS
ncbi:hypothetical protein [Actinacidiphila sp. bgisy145]|uniref:hypothetical protein n=1 Tax=Actinacidiphila sp. bgisy145 TaxID=3413792 RepID=UPI003EBF29BC